ncbi:hypothetical protein [Paracraurococcus lichenis]|uniref:Uncharacterized protein n=1 Tax=Paracraurococcus lichenis TaxID=3064888 RepID=A0ABT9DXY8_9PROT|nr:hypothetical protein [Paracraurococcus sp. LOR1-02]MDO9708761.1 hypothetical protein [Paracraurococcus sp. LOR1-02]
MAGSTHGPATKSKPDPAWLRAAAGLALGLLLPLAWRGLSARGPSWTKLPR